MIAKSQKSEKNIKNNKFYLKQISRLAVLFETVFFNSFSVDFPVIFFPRESFPLTPDFDVIVCLNVMNMLKSQH